MAKDFAADRVKLSESAGAITTSIGGDPRSVGVAGNLGSFCIQYSTGQWFRKIGEGDQDWQEVLVSGPIEAELFEILQTLREIRDSIVEIGS